MKTIPKSLAWQYFNRLDKSNAQCTTCSLIIKTSKGTTTGLRNHVTRKHPNLFAQMDRKRKQSSNDERDSKRSNSSLDDSPVSIRSTNSLAMRSNSSLAMRSNSSLAMKQEPFIDVNQTQPELNSPDHHEQDKTESLSIQDKVKKSFLELDAFNDDTSIEMMSENFDSFVRNEQLEQDNLNLKKKVKSSNSEINFLQKVNFLLMEMKDLKTENDDLKLNISQIKSRHQHEIEQLKILHRKQLSKITLLAESLKEGI